MDNLQTPELNGKGKLKKKLSKKALKEADFDEGKTESKKKTIVVPRLNLAVTTVTIDSISPLLVNKFDEKSKQQIADKQQKKGVAKKAARDPQAEWQASLYRMPGKKDVYGVPTSGLKNAMISACRYIEGIAMTSARGSFHILDDGSGLLPISGSKPVMDERICRIGPFGKKVAIPRYRGRFDKWSITFQINYNQNIISPEQLVNLLENAGFSVGLCEYRPEKSGNLGMFRVRRG